MAKKVFDWKKFVLGMERPAIALLAALLAYLNGLDQWSWLAGIGAERIWGTIRFYLK